MSVSYKVKPIGVIHSNLKKSEEVVDSNTDENIGEIEIYKDYEDGLSDLEGFSHIVVIFWMQKASFKSLKVRPLYHSEKLRGVFATRHPDRPNPIGATVVELLERKGNLLKVKGLDMIGGTPVLDIKPVTRRRQRAATRFGWLSDKSMQEASESS